MFPNRLNLVVLRLLNIGAHNPVVQEANLRLNLRKKERRAAPLPMFLRCIYKLAWRF